MAMIAVMAAISISSMIIEALLRPKIPNQTPLQDLQVSSSADGSPIPIPFGVTRYAGQIIWSPGLEFHYDKQGGSFFGGDPHVGQYVYDASFAVAFGEGPASISRIWADTKLIYKGGQPFGSFAPWSSTQDYVPDDLVSYRFNPGGGAVTAIFSCIIANKNIVPFGNNLYWQLTSFSYHDNTILYWPGAEVAFPGASTSSAGSGQIYACVVHSQGDNPSTSSRWKPISSYYAAPTIYPGNETQLPDPDIQAALGVANAPAFRGLCYAKFLKFPLANFGNRVPNLRAEVKATASADIDAMIQALCARAGLDTTSQIDVTALAAGSFPVANPAGYVIERPSTAADALREILNGFFIDARESGGKIQFLPRGAGGAPQSIAEEDLGLEEDKAKLVESFADELPLAEAVTVLFNDATVNYQQGKQLKGRNPRIITLATKNQKIVTMPFSLTPQQARQLAECGLYSEWQTRQKFATNLWKAVHILKDPGDWVEFNYESLTFLARLASVDVGGGLATALEALSDDARNYNSSAVGETHIGFTPPVQRSLPPTLLFLLDIPLLRDRDANLGGSGFYAALTSADPSWLSASLFESIDDVDFNLLDTSDGPVAFGTAQTTLAAPRSPWDWDTVNSLTIQMSSGTLSGDTDINVLNGANALLVGDLTSGNFEVIQFADCVDNGGGSFTISRLLRGRRGTEWACATHIAFETVIGITIAGGILREQRPLSEIGKQLFYLGVTDGDTVTPPGEGFTLSGQDLKPYAPCHIGGFIDANNNVVITWVRRTRLGWSSLSQDPVPLSEDSELYDVEILSALGAVIRTFTGLTVPTCAYLAAQIATDFGSIPANGITVNVYQKSGEVGRGFKGTGVVPTPGNWPPPVAPSSGNLTFHVNGN